MKSILFSAFIFCFYTGITLLQQQVNNSQQSDSSKSKADSTSIPSVMSLNSVPYILPHYNFIVKYLPEKKQLSVNGGFTWHNNSKSSVDEIYLNCYPNAYTTEESFFSKSTGVNTDPKSGLRINEFLISGESVERENRHRFNSLPGDSSLFRIGLKSSVGPGDSLTGRFSYTFTLPEGEGRSFAFGDDGEALFTQWFPRIAVLSDTGWAAYPLLPFAEFNNERIEIDLSVVIPDGFSILSGNLLNGNNVKGQTNFSASLQVIDYPLCFVKVNNIDTLQVQRNQGRLKINLYSPEKEKIAISRIVNGSIGFLENVLGNFPVKELNILPVANTMPGISGMEYSQFIVVPEISGDISEETEAVIFHETAHQYFYHSLNNNEAAEAWLDEGLVSYLTHKYLEKKTPETRSKFKMLGVYPVSGIQLMEFQKIPVIFTLEQIGYNRIVDILRYYYANNSTGSLSASSAVFQDANSYYTTSYIRGNLVFSALEKLVGEKRIFKILSSYYKNNRGKRVTAANLLKEVEAGGGRDTREIFTNLLRLNGPVDDKVESVFEYDNQAQINIRRTGDKSYPLYLTIGTDTDTTRKVIPGDKQFITYIHKLKSPFRFVEIDEKRLNIFDENYANNSYTRSFQFGAVSAFLLRWFFWMQNVLVIFGGIS